MLELGKLAFLKSRPSKTTEFAVSSETEVKVKVRKLEPLQGIF